MRPRIAPTMPCFKLRKSPWRPRDSSAPSGAMPAYMRRLPMNSRDGASTLCLHWPGTSPLSRNCAIPRTTAISISVPDRHIGHSARRARLCRRSRGVLPMDDVVSHTVRHTLVRHYLTEVSLLAKALCPEAQVEATTERYEDEDGHVRIYPPVGCSEGQ